LALSDERTDSLLTRKTEEAWILTKLGRRGEAWKEVSLLLKEFPDNPDLIQLGAMLSFDRGNIGRAKKLTKRLEGLLGDDRRVKELKARWYLEEWKYKRALRIYDGLIKERPDNTDYKRDRAEILALLEMWPEAKKAYKGFAGGEVKNRAVIWDYRKSREEGGVEIIGDMDYFNAPESLRQHYIREGARFWLNDRARMTLLGFEEAHRKATLGATPAIREIIPGHIIKAEYFQNGICKISADWKASYNDHYTFHEFGCEWAVDRPDFRTKAGARWNQLVRDPVEGILLRCLKDTYYAGAELLILDRIIAGDRFWIERYSVAPSLNTINGKGYLGYKIFNEAYANVIIVPKPYITFNFTQMCGTWDKTFENAQQVIDFIGDEKIYYFGIQGEDRIGKIATISGGFTRTYDSKRKFYSSYSNAAVDLWVNENMKLSFSYEFGLNVQGVFGAGDIQVWMTKLRIIF